MTTATPPATAHHAAADLAHIRNQWGDLLAAIEGEPVREWPPRDCRDFDHPQPDTSGHPTTRAPLTLREHPAPVNLRALDAALFTEGALFDLADQIAEQVQRPVRRRPTPTPSGRSVATVDADDRADPARWHYQAPTSPGSRAHGLHWAAVWIAGRLLDEPDGDLFRPVPPVLLDHAAAITARCADRIADALGRRPETTTLDRPCPYCRCGQLTARTTTDPADTTVTCSTGEACGAPVLLGDRGRRVWRAHDLPGLYAALTAAEERSA